jgi:hypothetical protein
MNAGFSGSILPGEDRVPAFAGMTQRDLFRPILGETPEGECKEYPEHIEYAWKTRFSSRDVS